MPVISPNAFAPPNAPPAANDAAGPVAATLREKVRRLERIHSAQRMGQAAVPLGVPAIDALLPDGGLLTGALHEIEAGPAPSGRVAAHDGAALAFASHLLGRFGATMPGTLLWCRRPSGTVDAPPYAPALCAWFDPARLLMATVRRDEDLFWALEEGLRCPGMAAVLGETRAADPTAGRRLSLAAEKSGVPALLLRAQPAPSQSVCTTRWRVASAPSRSTPGLSDVGAPRWRVELSRNRFGRPSAAEFPSWLLEWTDETHCLSVVPQAFHGSTRESDAERLLAKARVVG
jgi:protein ImuA